MKGIAEGLLGLVVVLAIGGVFYVTSGAADANSATSTTSIVTDPEAVARGELVANDTGCLACHTTDGTPSVGPTWKGLAGASRPLTSGESVIADDSYILESIVDPAAKVLAGFDPIMPPDYADVLSDQQRTDLVEYIKSHS